MQWLMTDRPKLETIIQFGAYKFSARSLHKLSIMLRYSFIAHQHSKFCNELKSTIDKGVFTLEKVTKVK